MGSVMRLPAKYLTATVCMMSMCSMVSGAARAEESLTPDPEFDEILALDIAELTVTSASRRPQKLNDASAAIYVITQEDLRRRGITSIPEALRMVPGMQVSQVASNRWAVSARGFNNTLSNKLLVLIDGRSIYTPVFSGTYWDDKTTLMENIDRIEVIRGPGSTLWGANAVNGVINIITKSARETYGQDYVGAGVGSDENYVEGRKGGQTSEQSYYRSYAQFFNRDNSELSAGGENNDEWYRARSGFRVDGALSEQDDYTLQGDVYGGEQDAQLVTPSLTPPFSRSLLSKDDAFGANIMGKWNRELSSDSRISLQSYIDHYSRHEATSSQNVTTADVQFVHNKQLDSRNNFVWGGGMRAYRYEVEGSFAASFNQESTSHKVFSAFAQDEYAILPEKWYLTFGSKVEYNDFTGLEIQPNVRTTWHPTEQQTVWAAISRAVRTPSVIEEDVDIAGRVTAGPPVTVLRAVGNPEQDSEEVMAYEIGHRIQPTKEFSFDTALFYNHYDKLATFSNPGSAFVDPQGNLTVPFPLSNLGSGHVYGLEEAVNWNVTDNWRLSASYTYMQMYLDVGPGTAATLESTERRTPRNQFGLSSYLDLSDTVHWDNMLYYVDDTLSPIQAYVRYDTQISWQVTDKLELSLVGRNLTDDAHPEFGATPQVEIGRSVLGRVMWKF